MAAPVGRQTMLRRYVRSRSPCGSTGSLPSSIYHCELFNCVILSGLYFTTELAADLHLGHDATFFIRFTD